MQLLEYNYINKFIHKFPRTDIKNLNIYGRASNNKTLFLDDAKYFVVKTKGKKAYIWFTYYEKNIMCILILLNNKNVNDKSNQFYKIDTQFDNTLCYNNVLLFGYYHKKYLNKTEINKTEINKTEINKTEINKTEINKVEKVNYAHNFVIENVYNYNILNNIITHDKYNHEFNSKLYLFSKILPLIDNQYIKNSVDKNISTHYDGNTLNICLPIILNSNDNIFKFINKFDLDYYCINIYSEDKYLGNYLVNLHTDDVAGDSNKKYLYTQPLKMEKFTANSNVKTKFAYNKLLCNFKITPCIHEDLYNLVILNNSNSNKENREEFYDLALINGYKTSVFMNSIFRKIKENANLDLLEESDDEEEFENIKKDKFVYLEKHVIMQCMYNYKFKKWIPLKIVNDKITTKTELYQYLGKNAK